MPKLNSYAMASESRSPSRRNFSTPGRLYVLDTQVHQKMMCWMTFLSFEILFETTVGPSSRLLSSGFKLLHTGQQGSIPRRTALDPIMLMHLTTDLSRIIKHNLACFDNYASACYDCLIATLGMLVARKCGMSSSTIRMHAEALECMKY